MQRTRLTVAKDETTSGSGMVVAQHPLIAEAGAQVLADGGNAMDAAVAAAFAAGVVEPFMSGIGGGGGLVVYDPSRNASTVVEFAMRVPALGHERAFELDPDAPPDGLFRWPAVKGSAMRIGWRAPLVPGTVAGLALALGRFGTWPLARVLAPAIHLAEAGFESDWYLTLNVACTEAELRHEPSTAAAYMPGGHAPRARLGFGEPVDRFVQPDLAETLQQIARDGPRAFYEGPFAAALERAMREHDGLLRAADLRVYRPLVSEPLECRYRGRYTIQAPPGPTAGPTLVQMLQMLDTFDLASLEPNGAAALHLLAETMRRAFADRFACLGDPDFAQIPFATITSAEFARERARTIDAQRADLDPAPHAACRGEPGGASSDQGPGHQDGSCTTHLCVVDRDRMLVSLTNTLGELWGSRVVIPRTGVLLNDGMVSFDPRPGKVNSVRDGRRPLSNMAPLIALRDGRPWLVLGAPGGRKILSGVLQSLVNLVDFGRGIQEAVSAPRIHSEDAVTYADSRLPQRTIRSLRTNGQQVEMLEETYAATNFSRVVGILVDDQGALHGGVHVWQPATAIGL